MFGPLIGLANIFGRLGVGICSLISFIIGGPIARLFIKFLIFSLKSSFILVLFLMGGPLFMFIGIFYIYYRLYKQVAKRTKDEEQFFKGKTEIFESELPE